MNGWCWQFWSPLLKLFLISQLPFRCLHSAKSNWIVLLITAWREVGNILSTEKNSLTIFPPCSQVGLGPIVLHQQLDKRSIFLPDECLGTSLSSALHFDVWNTTNLPLNCIKDLFSFILKLFWAYRPALLFSRFLALPVLSYPPLFHCPAPLDHPLFLCAPSLLTLLLHLPEKPNEMNCIVERSIFCRFEQIQSTKPIELDLEQP